MTEATRVFLKTLVLLILASFLGFTTDQTFQFAGWPGGSWASLFVTAAAFAGGLEYARR